MIPIYSYLQELVLYNMSCKAREVRRLMSSSCSPDLINKRISHLHVFWYPTPVCIYHCYEPMSSHIQPCSTHSYNQGNSPTHTQQYADLIMERCCSCFLRRLRQILSSRSLNCQWVPRAGMPPSSRLLRPFHLKREEHGVIKTLN